MQPKRRWLIRRRAGITWINSRRSDVERRHSCCHASNRGRRESTRRRCCLHRMLTCLARAPLRTVKCNEDDFVLLKHVHVCFRAKGEINPCNCFIIPATAQQLLRCFVEQFLASGSHVSVGIDRNGNKRPVRAVELHANAHHENPCDAALSRSCLVAHANTWLLWHLSSVVRLHPHASSSPLGALRDAQPAYVRSGRGCADLRRRVLTRYHQDKE
mmetsp:Transcript_889/g.2036  ORF Transcript_889/g.2036 Transcript_889/m.2036 type:complete len:215 (-) Transcript_889:16-660(-)